MEIQTPIPSVVTPQVVVEQPKSNNFLMIFLSVLIFISVLVVGFFAYRNQQLVKELQMVKENVNKKQLTTDTSTNSFVKLDNLKAGDVVSSPLLISGTIDRSWTFESTFSIEIQDQNRQSLNTVPVNTVFSGDQNQYDSFSEVIQFITTETSGFIIIHADNPSGLPENDKQVEIPVKFYNFVDTSDWKVYRYLDIFEIKVPNTFNIVDLGNNYVRIGDYISISSSTVNPEDCKGDCYISGPQVSKTVNGVSMKYASGWWGEIGGNIAQNFIAYIVHSKNYYTTIQLQELPFDAKYVAGRKILDIPQERISEFNKIMSTFKYTSN